MKSEIFQKEFKNCPLAYIKWGNAKLENQQNFKRLLEILNINVNNFQEITQPTQFEKIILADASIDVWSYFTSTYHETIEYLRNFALKNRMPTSSKKIYYFHGSRQFGEERLAEYFKSKGYEIVRPEKLTLDEQLNLLINCENFASTVGSTSHNLIFLPNGAEVILIPRGSGYIGNPYQQTLNQIYPMNVTYVDSSLSLFFNRNEAFFYFVSEHLKRFFGDKFDGYDEEDFKTFLQYVKDSIGKGISANPKEKAYYEPILPDFMAQLKQREDLIADYDMPPRWEQFRPSLTYQTHVGVKGWGEWNSEDKISNDIEQKFDLQAIKINYPGHKVYYSVYYNAEEGWSQEVESPNMAGTTGQAKAIFGLRSRLDEADTKEFDILYRVHKFDGAWSDWAKNGEVIYSHGQKLNAIQIKLEAHVDKKNQDNKSDDVWNALSKNSETIYLNGQKVNVIQIELEPKT